MTRPTDTARPTASPAGHRRSKGPGRIQDACPGCCVGPEGQVYGTAAFEAGWDRASSAWNDSEAGWDSPKDRAPVWICNNCDHEMPRRIRRSKLKIAYDNFKARQADSNA